MKPIIKPIINTFNTGLNTGLLPVLQVFMAAAALMTATTIITGITGAGDVYAIPEQGLLWSYDLGGNLYTLDISDDGEYIAAGTGDGRLYLLNRDGKKLLSYKVGKVTKGAVISPDGRYLLAGALNEKIYLFRDGGRILEKDMGAGISSVDVSGDGNYLAIATGNILSLLVQDGNILWSREFKSHIYSVSIDNSGEFLAAGYGDGNITLLDRNGDILWSYPVESNVKEVLEVSISKDGEFIAAGAGQTVYLIDRDRNLLWQYTPGDRIKSVKVSGGGDFIIAASKDSIYLFDRYGHLLLEEQVALDDQDELEKAGITSDGSYTLLGTWAGIIGLYNTSILEKPAVVAGEEPEEREGPVEVQEAEKKAGAMKGGGGETGEEDIKGICGPTVIVLFSVLALLFTKRYKAL